MAMKFNETDKYKLGRTGELLIAKLLQKRGWYIIPSYDYTGEDNDKAPKLQGNMNAFVIPDLDISKAGSRRWAEVKTKTEATFTRITGRLEHGIPSRHYRSYKEVQDITGCEVWLFVYETNTGDVLYGKLDELEKKKRDYEGRKMSYGGMVFFPRDSFGLFANIKVS